MHDDVIDITLVHRYLEDEEARQEDEDLVERIVAMELHVGIEAELEAAVRAHEARAASVHDCAAAHEALGSGASSVQLVALL